MKSLKVVFMGTPEFALPALVAIRKKFNLIACYTQPSRPAGRGQKISHSFVKEYCINKNIKVYTPKNFKKKEEIENLKKMNCDIFVVAAYGIILPKEILSIPKFGAINIHASLLPRWRGAAPIQYAILKGDKKTGITIMQMNEKLDSGNILLQKEIIIENKNAKNMHDELAKIGAELIINILKKIENNENIKSIIQNESEATYAKKITSNESKIIWNKNGKEILRQIKALGAWFITDKQRIKIFEAEISSSNKKIPGLIIDKNFSITCGNGDLIHPKILQKSGGKKMNINEFLKGFKFKVNQKVE